MIALTLLLSRWFHAPERIAALRARVLGPRAPGASVASVRFALSAQVAVSLVVLGALWWLASWLGRTIGRSHSGRRTKRSSKTMR